MSLLKQCWISLFTCIVAISFCGTSLAKDIKVRGYTKKDGTKVNGYVRHTKTPDKIKVKPYVKKDGTKVKEHDRSKPSK